MHQYLKAQAQPLIADVASRMLRGGNFTIVPGQHVPDLDSFLTSDALPSQEVIAPGPPSETQTIAWAAAVAAAQPLTE